MGEKDGKPKGSNTATQLVQIVERGGIELFHTSNELTYASIRINEHVENWRIHSRHFKSWLSQVYYKTRRKTPGAQALDDACNALHGKALFENPECQAFVRIAGDENVIFIDLGNPTWQAVEITSKGWRVIDKPPVKFVRPRGMKALPTPQRGGKLNRLSEFLNIYPADWPLVIGWLIGAYKPTGPYEGLAICAEQGCAKSFTQRILCSMIDPVSAGMRGEPRDERDLAIRAFNSWVVSFDNLSSIRPWFSDALCRLSTGGGFGTRELYSDDCEFLLESMRPIILNGISEVVTRGDLAERVTVVFLPTIDDKNRKTESELWDKFGREQPKFLGALYDVLAIALKEFPQTRLKHSPRMADYVRWVTAAESGLRLKQGEFLAAYQERKDEMLENVLAACAVAEQIREFMKGITGSWEGTYHDLKTELEKSFDAFPFSTKPRDWPQTEKALSGQLRRLRPSLKRAGIFVEELGKSSQGYRVRLSKQAARMNMLPVNVGEHQ